MVSAPWFFFAINIKLSNYITFCIYIFISEVDLRHKDGKAKDQNEKVRLKSDTSVAPLDIVDLGIDLKEFYKSVGHSGGASCKVFDRFSS